MVSVSGTLGPCRAPCKLGGVMQSLRHALAGFFFSHTGGENTWLHGSFKLFTCLIVIAEEEDLHFLHLRHVVPGHAWLR